ncbi:MAG: outer membrane beta-barrel protein [Pseudomonadota bacterium]
MRKIIIYFSLLFMILAQANVHAEWYVGANSSTNSILPYPSSLSEANLSLEPINRYNIENSSSSVSLFGGFRSNEYFSLQLEYQDELSFGVDNIFTGSSLWIPNSTSDRFDSNGLFLSGISSYPINDSGVLYMKGGLFSWEVDSEYYQTSEHYLGENRGTDLFYGLGASYDLNTRFGISAEWERYKMEESEIDYLSTKFRFKF